MSRLMNVRFAPKFLLLCLLVLLAGCAVNAQSYVETPPVATLPATPAGPPPTATPFPTPAPTMAFSDTGSTRLFLPIVAYSPQPMQPPFDMVDFMVGDGRLYEVQHSSGSQARHQTQEANGRFYHTKGHEVLAEWEELWATSNFIFRGTDTSPGNGQYYTLRDNGQYGSAWSPRRWQVGDLFARNPQVTFYWKSDCSASHSDFQASWLRFDAYHLTYTFPSNITLAHVIELSWLPSPTSQPIETYFYAVNYGLVGWRSNNGDFSYISEIHEPGTRPDNTREVIPCLNSGSYWPKLLPLVP